MSEPLTRIDTRFSQPNTTAAPWSETQKALEAAELFWITTVRADGRPHVTPLVAVWVDDALYFSTGGTEQKAMNLRANNHVVLTTGCNAWTEGIDVMVEGDAVAVTDNATLSRLVEAWTHKWDGRWQYQVGDGRFHDPDGGDPLVFGVSPTKVMAFGKGTFTHTTYRF
jgi:general stress protein 26